MNTASATECLQQVHIFFISKTIQTAEFSGKSVFSATECLQQVHIFFISKTIQTWFIFFIQCFLCVLKMLHFHTYHFRNQNGVFSMNFRTQDYFFFLSLIFHVMGLSNYSLFPSLYTATESTGSFTVFLDQTKTCVYLVAVYG